MAAVGSMKRPFQPFLRATAVDRKKDQKPSNKDLLSLEDTGKARLRIVKGHAAGMDPYDGALPPKAPGIKKDLRKLGEWLETKRKAEELARQEAELSSTAAKPKDRRKKD